MEACAMTVHNSQASTLDKVVFNYERGWDQQLVYVGLSRMTSIYGLHLTNHNSEYMFHYWKGSNTSKIKDLRTDLTRLERHNRLIIIDRAKQFHQRVSLSGITMTTLNVKSFARDSPKLQT
jgi:hypothetical protein